MPWELTGNGGTDPTVDFVGTTDGQPLVIRTGNPATERLRIDAAGNVGIGTAVPVSPLDVRSASRIASLYTTTNGNQWVEVGNAVTHMNLGVGASGSTAGVPYLWSASGNFFVGDDGGPTLFVQGMGSGKVGIGTTTPAATLDVSHGLLHVEGSTNPTTTAQGAYLGWNALTGGTGETDFINNQGLGTGGFAFMNTPPSGNPRTTLMVITGGGRVGVGTGTETPSAMLSVVPPGRAQVVGTALSGVLLASGGPIPPWTGYPFPNNPGSVTVASLGVTVDGLNNVSLGVRAIRNGPNPVGWSSVDLVLGFDVDNTVGAGAQLLLGANGNIFASGGFGANPIITREIAFTDGTTQTTAGLSVPPQVVITRNTAGGGFISLLDTSGRQKVVLTQDNQGAGGIALAGRDGAAMVRLESFAGGPDNGAIAVTDAAGAAAGIFKAIMFVNPANGEGTISASVKNFRVANPNQAGTDIVYGCIEGPEAAAYIRGTAHLLEGRATVLLPDHFVSVTARTGITVHITPLSSDSLGLAVVEKRPDAIVVQELHNGTGSYDFDWEIKSVRKGHESYQIVRPSNEMALPQPVLHG